MATDASVKYAGVNDAMYLRPKTFLVAIKVPYRSCHYTIYGLFYTKEQLSPVASPESRGLARSNTFTLGSELYIIRNPIGHRHAPRADVERESARPIEVQVDVPKHKNRGSLPLPYTEPCGAFIVRANTP